MDLKDLNVDLSKRFKYEGIKGNKLNDEIFSQLYQIQLGEYQHFLKEAKRYAIIKITDKPQKRLTEVVGLREKVTKLTGSIAKKVSAL